MELALSVLKVVSMLASGAFGVLGVLTNEGDENRERTRKIALAGIFVATSLSVILHVLESRLDEEKTRKAERVSASILDNARKTSERQSDALAELSGITSSLRDVMRRQEQAVDQGAQISTKVTATLESQSSVLGAQRRVTHQVLRAYYPLEPVTLFFEREFPMDQPALTRYVARMQSAIAEKLSASRNKPPPHDLRGEAYVELTGEPAWLPIADGAEHEAWRALMTDATSFSFAAGPRENDIVFASLPPNMRNVFASLSPQPSDVAQKIDLTADFDRRVITKLVRCDSAMRSGGDVAAVSAIDLVGRTVAPVAEADPDADSRVTRIALTFRYDYDTRPTRSRYIVLPTNGAPPRVKAEHLGLLQVLAGAGERR